MTIRKKYFDIKDEVERLNLLLEGKDEAFNIFLSDIFEERNKAKHDEEMFHAVVEAAAGKIGQDFFDNIVIKISEWLGAECVLIGRKIEGERIEAVPLYLDGKISHGFTYKLNGTPCDITTRKGYCLYSENVINIFPEDEILIKLNAEGYIGSALYDKTGKINGVICAISRNKLSPPTYSRDILKILGSRVSAELERIRIEEELKQSEAELRISNASKDKFFSILAHDLKNPLNSIAGFSKLLLSNFECYDTEKQKKFLTLINESTVNTEELLENILNWSLSNSGQMDLIREPINLHFLITENMPLFNDFAGKKNILIVSTIPADIIINADKNMLLSILRNLIINSIKFTHANGLITISHNMVSRNETEIVELVIEDTGIGIEPERIPTLFEFHNSISTVGTNNEKGTGLGLVLCKEFIDKHGGYIRVESVLNQGTRFIFTIE